MIEWHEEKAGTEGELMVSRAGEGAPLVVIHGITSGRWTWEPVAERLAGEYELFVYDQRGHGSSRKPNRGYLLSDYASDLDLVLDHFGIERPLILGHSLGGMVTLEWAIGQPDRARALVIEDSPMRRGGEGIEELFANWIALSRMTPDEAEAAYLANDPTMSQELARKRAESITVTAPAVFTELRDSTQALGGASVIDDYRGITSPALLVYGDLEAGGMVPGFDAESFRSTLPNAEIVNIAGGGHGLHTNNTEDFLAAVLPFLARYRDA